MGYLRTLNTKIYEKYILNRTILFIKLLSFGKIVLRTYNQNKNKGGETVKDDFVTYDEFESFIDGVERYTYEYSNNDLHVFYDYGTNEKTGDLIPVRQPLFSISLLKAFVIVAPYGYRLTQAKAMIDFNKVEKMAIELSRTPIYKRGSINRK